MASFRLLGRKNKTSLFYIWMQLINKIMFHHQCIYIRGAIGDLFKLREIVLNSGSHLEFTQNALRCLHRFGTKMNHQCLSEMIPTDKLMIFMHQLKPISSSTLQV